MKNKNIFVTKYGILLQKCYKNVTIIFFVYLRS